MAKIVLKRGSIYFLKEKDYLTGEITRFTKIGLVRADKKTESRISEHQTGNPRDIYNYESFEAPFVEHLETLLHYRFAEKWVTGEWFVLTNVELDAVIKEAKHIIEEQSEIESTLNTAYDLEKEASKNDEISCTQEAELLWKELLEKKLEKEIITTRRGLIENEILLALGESSKIEGVVEIQFKKGSDYFNEKLFKEENEDLYKSFVVKNEPKLSGTFTIKGKLKLADRDSALSEQKKQTEKFKIETQSIKRDSVIQRNSMHETLHLQYIQLQSQLMDVNWEYDQLEAQLKILVGNNCGIEGVCGWKRVLKESSSFDKKSFQKEHPKLYDKYIQEKAETHAVIFHTHRAYSRIDN